MSVTERAMMAARGGCSLCAGAERRLDRSRPKIIHHEAGLKGVARPKRIHESGRHGGLMKFTLSIEGDAALSAFGHHNQAGTSPLIGD